MPLPWVRLDVNIGTHDKILRLLSDTAVSEALRFRAAFSYVVALGWAGGQGTDGRIEHAALPFVHGNAKTARMLVKHNLWTEAGPTTWQIVNFAERQQTEAVTEAISMSKSRAGRLGNCIRHHGKNGDPGPCWDARTGRCNRDG